MEFRSIMSKTRIAITAVVAVLAIYGFTNRIESKPCWTTLI